MDKSYVTIETNLCLVCAKQHDTGAILMDLRMRERFNRNTCTGMSSMCPECQEKYDDDYVALVAVHNPPAGDKEKLTQENANRAGDIIHLRRRAFKEIFNIPCERPSGKLRPMVFVDLGVIDHLKAMIPPQSTAQEEAITE